MPRPGRTVLLAVAAVLLGTALAAGVRALLVEEDTVEAPPARARVLFDDFAHAGRAALAAAGWVATRPAGVTLAGGLLRLRSRAEAAVCHVRAYRLGTFAARVRLDRPGAQAFAAGGAFAFVHRRGVLVVATPGGAPRRVGRPSGWHVLVARVGARGVTYSVDGVTVAAPRGPAPARAAALAFAVGAEGGAAREAALDVDWVFHHQDAALAPEQVASAVATLRAVGVAVQDGVPNAAAPARSGCRA